MRRKKDRDLEKVYPRGQFIAKLRRLAETLAAEKPFTIQIAGERLFVPKTALVNIEHEREGVWEEVEFQIKWKNKEESLAPQRGRAVKGVGRPRRKSSPSKGSKRR